MAASHYRFYFMSGGQTFAAEVIECDGDGAALEKANELLSVSKAFYTMEVWQGSRKIGAVERPQQ